VDAEGRVVIAELNRLVASVEDRLTDDLDLPSVASELGTTEYHLRRMFSSLMDARITDRSHFRLIGHAVRVPLIHEGINPHIQAHIASIPVDEHARLKDLSNTEPPGLLQVSADVDPDYTEGSDLTYLHGIAVDAVTAVPDDLDVIDVPSGTWAVFRAEGDYPAALQSMWAATATEWFPSNPWRLRPGPSIVTVLDRSDDFRTATCELWLPVERAGRLRDGSSPA
jgi:AraC family transcriptional regulator